MKRKCRRVYHFLSAQYALDDLEKCRLKLSEFGKVNDDEELQAYRLNIADNVPHCGVTEAEIQRLICLYPRQPIVIRRMPVKVTT